MKLFLFILLFVTSVCFAIDDEERVKSFKNKDAAKKFLELRKLMGTLNAQEQYERFKKLSEEYPDEIVPKVILGAQTGDLGQTKPQPEQRRMKAEAVRIIEPFTHMKFEDSIGYARILVFNEYYYHSGQYRKQFEFGQEINRLGGRGDYSIGVGGSQYALELHRKGKKAEARKYAEKSRAAWERLDPPESLRKNSFYLVVLVLTGDRQKAIQIFDETYKNTPEYQEEKCCWKDNVDPRQI